MRRLVLLDTAKADLRRIQLYIARASRRRATGEALALKLLNRCERLASLPGTLGRPRPELKPGMRSFPYRRYLIFFRYRDDVLEVINIIESHRDLPRLFRDKP